MGEKLHYSTGKNNPDPNAIVQFVFWCPGCDCAHGVRVRGTEPVWSWNGSLEAPTFNPSLLVNGHDPKTRCHSFIRDGKIQFLSDCSHDLKNQTIEIPDWDYWKE